MKEPGTIWNKKRNKLFSIVLIFQYSLRVLFGCFRYLVALNIENYRKRFPVIFGCFWYRKINLNFNP